MSGGKRNPELDREAQQWIEAVIGEKFPSGSYEDAIKDGIILCKYVVCLFFYQVLYQYKMNVLFRLMNKLQPGSVSKICTSGGGFKLRENVSAFRMF